MAAGDATDPASRLTPVPLEGDGRELIGLVIDNRYKLDSTLGRGGMGLVFRATHVGLRRQVAVKILHPSLAASPEVRNRFEREALSVGKIDHPNCVSTYDVGRLPDGSLYLAMELLEGRALSEVLEDERQLAPGRALHILGHVLRGLGHIHAAGLIHRDMKPENIFLIRQGDDYDFAKILDFGIAKPIEGEIDDGVRLTQAGMAFGTPIYMAPEQALGNPLDGRADLYAASILAYEMLCGQPPFYSDDKLEVMAMHTGKPVPPMRSRLIKGGKPVPSSLEKMVAKGLAKKPSDRYRDAAAYLAAVESALETPDGGVTEVEFERPDTGSQPLVTEDGTVRITGGSEVTGEASEKIGQAIEDALEDALASAPTKIASPSGPARLATLAGAGVAPELDAPDPPIVAKGSARGRPVVGGVGIGLPYTGPSGEPIFGLTPEQRLASAKPRKRTGLYLAIGGAMVAVAAGIAIAIVTRPAHHGDRSALAESANEALDRGDPGKAIALLEAQPAAIAQDRDAELVLGHAHAARHESAPSLDAYRHALELDPLLEADPALRSNLRAMAADRDPDVVRNAFDLWVGHTQDPTAKKALLNAAISEDLDRRRAAAPLIDRYKLGDSVEWLTAYSFDLEQEATCELRQQAVSRLRALGDARAVPALERALARRGKSGAYKGKPINGCLADDARAAIGYLRGLVPVGHP